MIENLSEGKDMKNGENKLFFSKKYEKKEIFE